MAKRNTHKTHKTHTSTHTNTQKKQKIKKQGGPRICLGQNLAMMQLQYGLALLLLAFGIEAVEGGTGVRMFQKSATLPMEDGVRVRLTPLAGKA